MSERELRSSVAGASKDVKTNSKTAFDELTRIRPYQGKAFRSPYTPLNDAVQSRSAPYSLDPSLSRLLGHVRPPSWLPARLGSYRSPGVRQLRSNSAISVATLICERSWKRNSSPIRRAGSPVQVSSFPRTAKFTPASLSNCTVARATFCARGSNDAAQPIQNRYSKAGFDSTVGASRRSAQASADIRVANTGSSSKKALDICEKPEGPVSIRRR